MAANRFGRLLKSSVNALLQPAEDPRTSDIGPGHDELVLLRQVQVAAARLGETRSRLAQQRSGVLQRIASVEEEARAALRTGQESLARLTLQRGRLAHEELQHLDQQIAGLQREENRLSSISRQIGVQIEAIRAREEMASARYSAAKVQVAVGEALNGLNPVWSDAGMIEQIERDAEEMQAKASAIESLSEAGVFGGYRMTRMPVETDRNDDIEARLQQLKQEMLTNS